MDPILGGLITGGANLLGSVFGTTQNNANAQAMQQQAEAYNTQMSSTAYQRASADMKAAGLNPMMMFGSGSAALSPSIQPAVKTSAAGGVGSAISGAVSSAVAMRTADATVNNLVQENANLKTKQLLDKANIDVAEHTSHLTQSREDLTNVEARTKNEALASTINEATRAKNELEFRKTGAGKLLDQAGMAGRNVSDVVSPVGNILSSAKATKNLFTDRFGNW